MDGIVVINKPSGPTSFAVVSLVKRITGEKRVGHGGTLDPQASGVLPIFLGQATRLVEYLHIQSKIYQATIELGVTSDTYDTQGKLTRHTGAERVTRAELEHILPEYLGNILQTPPSFSALKFNGQPLYKLARQGLRPTIEPREIVVYRLEIIDFQSPFLTIIVRCGKGTYIRSLAHDLGQRLGVGACLKGLVRMAYGPFDIEHAIPLERLSEAIRKDQLPELIHPPDSVLSGWPSVKVTTEQQSDIRDGKQLEFAVENGDRLRAYASNGQLIGLLVKVGVGNLWRPEKVFDFKPCQVIWNHF
jgi:tRNA pseudouridine55 synthase